MIANAWQLSLSIKPAVHLLCIIICVDNLLLAAALALMDTNLEAEEIVRKSMKIAGDICVYTNHNLIVESLEAKPAVASAPEDSAKSS